MLSSARTSRSPKTGWSEKRERRSVVPHGAGKGTSAFARDLALGVAVVVAATAARARGPMALAAARRLALAALARGSVHARFFGVRAAAVAAAAAPTVVAGLDLAYVVSPVVAARTAIE